MRQVRIGDVGEIITGKTPKTSISEYYNGTFPFLTPVDFSSLKVIKDTKKTISQTGLESIKKCFIPKNSICVTCIGSDMGKVAVNMMDCATNQQINSVIPYKENDYNFIYYAIKNVSHLIKRMGEASTAVPIVNKTDFSNIYIYCPQKKEEQIKISSKLNSYDMKIENNIDKIYCLIELIYTIFENYFDKYINTHNNKQLLTSVFENITEIKEKNREEKDYPVLSVVKEGEFKASEDVFTKQVYSKSTKNYKIVRRNQVAYNPARANIGSIAMLKEYDVGLVSPIYTVFEVKDTITPTFFYYYMKQPIFQEMIKHHAIGTTRQNFPFEAFKMFPMVVPPMELQLKFEEIAKPIEQKIAKLKEENEVLAEIRDTLLPKLMSGELPVEVGEN